MFTRILIPLDGSQISERGLQVAQQIAPRTNPELFLLHVVDPSREAAAHMHQSYLNGVAENCRQFISKQTSRTGTGITKVTPVLLHGDPVTEIVNFAHKSEARLIIMSTRNRTGIRRWALGSVSEKVYRQTDCPCILIGANGDSGPAPAGKSIGRILVPVGSFADQKKFSSYAEAFDTRIVSEVIFLQVAPPILSIDEAEYQKVAPEFTRSAYADRLEQSQKEEAMKHLASFTSIIKSKGIATTAVVMVGSTADSILKYARESNIDLIALPAEGQSAFGQWILGKLSKTLLREGRTPVLIVKPLKSSSKKE